MSANLENLIPLSERELAEYIERTMAVMRARKEIGRTASDGFVASKMVERLGWSGVRAFRTPGHEMSPAQGNLFKAPEG